MICAGIDGGSRAVKVVLLDPADRRVLGQASADQQIDQDGVAMRLVDELLAACGRSRSEIASTVATGYARGRIRSANGRITEIRCHAAGVHHLVPDAASIIEIGGQDSKVIWLEPNGEARDFRMNDRCAAGTGRFLEMVACRLESSLAELGELARLATAPAAISSTCVVFAETEIVSLLASGVAREDIIAGVQEAMVSQIERMAAGILNGPVVFAGGVALVPGMREALERALQQPVSLAPHPQYTGALGAALLAARQM